MTAPSQEMADPRQLVVDEVVTAWPDVKAKQVFGHRGWVRGGKMFGFLAGRGAAVRITPAMDDLVIMARDGVERFAYHGRPMKGWAVLPLGSDDELDAAVDLVRQAYETVGG
jgi:hypothetical protein